TSHPLCLTSGFRLLRSAHSFPTRRSSDLPGCFPLVPGLHLLLQVILNADLVDQLELGLDPVDVLLLVVEDAREEGTRDVVLHRRSEERRVGKESRGGRGRDYATKNRETCV